jgi:tetratricopeptide (TPR) repeat protein
MTEKTADNINRTARDLYEKALAALERNNLDYAIEMFVQCLSVEPNFTKARQFLRAAQMKKTESAGGLKRMFVTAKTTPLLTKAKMSASKNPPEAMTFAEQILSEDPKNGQALLVLAEAAEAGNFPETTVQTLEHYTKLNPRDTKNLHWLARAYRAAERHDMAREVYERLLQMNPNDFAAQKGLKDATALGATQVGGWDDAKSYRDVIKDKEEAVALEQQSRVVRAEDMTANLIKENLEKLSREPDSAFIQRELGKLYAQNKDFDTALRYLEKIFATEAGTDPTLEREIAEIKANRILDKIGKKKEQLAAQPASKAAIEKEIAELEKEHTQLLLMDAERLVERYPNDLMYRFELGVLYVKAGNIDGAIEQLQKSRGQPQRRVASLNYLGQCYQRMGLPDMAVDTFQEAINELPTMDGLKKELLYNLGSAYELMGDSEKAVAAFKEIFKVDIGFRDVREKVTRRPPQKQA